MVLSKMGEDEQADVLKMWTRNSDVAQGDRLQASEVSSFRSMKEFTGRWFNFVEFMTRAHSPPRSNPQYTFVQCST